MFSVWFGWLAPLAEWLQLLITALPMTILALLVYRYASNQEGITLAKDRIKGYLLELWLYKDDLGVMLRAQGQVIWYSLRYLGLAMVPLAIMIAPLGLVIVQLESHFAFQSLQPGQSAILSVTVGGEKAVSELDVGLSVPEGIAVDTPAMRVDGDRQLLWRLTVAAPGQHEITINVGEQQVVRRLVVGARGGALWPVAYRADDWRVLGSAAEPAVPATSSIISTELDYARARGEALGLSSASWLLLLFTLMLGFALRGIFGVTF